MIINISKSPVQYGRHKVVAPGNKIPDVPMSAEEMKDIEHFIGLKYFKRVDEDPVVVAPQVNGVAVDIVAPQVNGVAVDIVVEQETPTIEVVTQEEDTPQMPSDAVEDSKDEQVEEVEAITSDENEVATGDPTPSKKRTRKSSKA